MCGSIGKTEKYSANPGIMDRKILMVKTEFFIFIYRIMFLENLKFRLFGWKQKIFLGTFIELSPGLFPLDAIEVMVSLFSLLPSPIVEFYSVLVLNLNVVSTLFLSFHVNHKCSKQIPDN